jgi:uncharacterized protein
MAQGIELFNQQQFWHAHEAWEQAWLHANDPVATLYKGLIQTAAALVHWQRNNPKGLRLNWAKARPKLAAITQHTSGQTSVSASLDLADLIASMDAFVAATTDEREPAIPIIQLLRL